MITGPTIQDERPTEDDAEAPMSWEDFCEAMQHRVTDADIDAALEADA